MKQPDISIIMPSLNMASYIRKCLDSVIGQTLRGIEILCVDAGSTDGTLEILNEYARKDDRIRVLRSDRKSYGYQINLGIDNAAGRYLGIVETDDFIIPEMYEKLLAIADRESVQALKADFRFFYETSGGEIRYIRQTILNRLPKTYYGRVIDASEDPDVLKANVAPWAGIYDLEFLRENHIRLNETPGASYQDNGFRFQVYTRARRVYFENEAFYCLRRDNPNSSFHSKGKVYCMCDEYDFIREYLRKNPGIETRFAPYCALYRFKNYEWNLNRIGEEYRREFLDRFAEDFRVIEAAGELERSLYDDGQWERLQTVMRDPEAYYYQYSPLTYDFFRCLPTDRYEEALIRRCRETDGRAPDLASPQTFYDKIQWLKLYDRTPLKKRLCDLYQRRKWLREKIGEQFLPRMIGMWNSFGEIDFSELPESFVLRAANGHGFTCPVPDKQAFDREEAEKLFTLWLATNYAVYSGLELQYAEAVPSVIAEEYLPDTGNCRTDYQFYCFNGVPRFVMAKRDRPDGYPSESLYNMTWTPQRVNIIHEEIWPRPERPKQFRAMKRIARFLSKRFAFVRITFCTAGDRIVLTDMEFTPSDGLPAQADPALDQKWGAMLKLPENKRALSKKSFEQKGTGPRPDIFISDFESLIMQQYNIAQKNTLIPMNRKQKLLNLLPEEIKHALRSVRARLRGH